MKDFFERYADRIAKGETDECWPWTGCAPRGYGNLGRSGRSHRAHRCAYECEHGDGSALGLVVRHKCDNPICVNPSHLEIGSQPDNVRDMIARKRDRKAFGEASPQARLTDERVLEMRALARQSISICEIARRYGVDDATAYSAIRGQTWKHLPTETVVPPQGMPTGKRHWHHPSQKRERTG